MSGQVHGVLAPLLTLGLLACAPPPAEEMVVGTVEPEDTAAMVYDVEDPQPALSTDQIGSILQDVIALGVPNPDAIAETYASLMVLGGERCPGTNMTLYEPAGGCLTEDDMLFSGIGWYDVADSFVGSDGETVELSYAHGGDFEILTRDGARFAGGGEIEVLSSWEGETLTSSIDLAGTWVHSVRTDWLGSTLSAVFLATSRVEPGGNGGLTVTGGLGLGGTHLFLDALTWDTDDACAGSVSGAIRVRDERGFWYVWDLGQDCDACGDVVFHEDQPIGELCMDLSGWGAAWRSDSAPH